MFETTESVLDGGAIFSGQGFQLRKGGQALFVGMLQMLVPPMEGSEEFSIHAFWLAEIVFPGPKFVSGRRNHEIKLSADGLVCEPYAQCYPSELPIGRVILRSGAMTLVLYTKNFGPRYHESQVAEWLETAVAA